MQTKITPRETHHQLLRLAHVSLDDVSLNDPELGEEPPQQQDELAAKTDAYKAGKAKLNKRLRALDKAIRVAGKRRPVFVDEDNRSLFDDAQTLAKEQVDLANKIIIKPNADGVIDIAGMTAHLDKGDQYLSTMQVAYQKGQGVAVEELKELKVTAQQHQQKVEALYKGRDDFAKWDIDLTEFDDAYSRALDNFTEMNKAINGYVVADVDKTLATSKEQLNEFAKASQKAERFVDAAEAELFLKVSMAERGIAELFTKRSELENDPAQLSAFDRVYNAATADTARANAAIRVQHGREIDSAAQDAEKRLTELQQIFLQAKGSSSEEAEITPADNGDADYIKQLSKDVAALNKTVESVDGQRDLIKNHGLNFAEFKNAHQAAKTSVVGAQSDLLAGDTRSAESRMSDVRNSIAEMKGLVKEAEAALDVVADQIVLLRKEFAGLADNRVSFAKLAELSDFGAKQLRKFDSVCGEVDARIDYAEACITSQSINEAYQAIDNSQDGMKRLKGDIESLLWMPKISTAATEQEAKESFEKAIAKVRDGIEEFSKKRTVFKDTEELKIFENIHDKAVGFADQADNFLARKKFEQAEDVLENARVTLDGLETVYERGLNTAAKVETFLAEVEETKDRINAVYKQGIALENQDHKNDFLSYNTIATDFALQVEGYIGEGKTKDARAILAKLKIAIVNLESCLTQTPQTTDPKAEPEPVVAAPQEQAPEESTADDPRTSEQKELATQASQINTAIHTTFSQGRPMCVDEYVKNLEDAYAAALERCEEATALVSSGNIESAKAAISGAKQALILLQRIQDNSRTILASLMNGITEGASYYEQGAEETYAKRAEFDDWSIDLTVFDKAYSIAKDNLANLRAAIKASQTEVAKVTLNTAEDYKQALAEAYAVAKSDRDLARTDLIIQCSDVQSALSRLSTDRPRLEGDTSLSGQFDKIYGTAFSGVERMLAAMKASNGKAAEKEILEVERLMATLEELLNQAEPLAPEEEEQAETGDTTTVVGEGERILAAIDGLQGELNSYNSNKEVFKLSEERSNFESMYDKTKAFVDKARALLAAGEDGKAEDVLENAQITMESVQIAFERGQSTAARIDDYQQVLEQANNKVTKLYGQHNLIKDEQELLTFTDHSKTASETALKAEAALKTANFALADAELGAMHGLIANMEKLIKLQSSKRHKLKAALKRKRKK
ncbi:hypothetical protein [Pseudovibrio sp. Tun.PSC04-5.I4]|uniref:hypothetical protein n=1 Tax=Pseudovibrio sp. Tun.PSC04-5.I4 TaxID=1798213 RepID=UPI000B88D15F|nr:hypothetical protein [Pseudovibrio sp. Tun.PSC04-5.I4]